MAAERQHEDLEALTSEEREEGGQALLCCLASWGWGKTELERGEVAGEGKMDLRS